MRVYVQLLELWPLAKFQAQIWQFWKLARISETAARRANISSISTPWGRRRVCATSKIHAQNRPWSRKPLLVEQKAKITSILTPWGRMNVHVQILELWPLAKFHGQIRQFWKLARISETAARRAKISSISTPWGRRRVYVQLLKFMPQIGHYLGNRCP